MVQHHQLEIACQGQIAALAGGREIVLIDPEVRKYAIEQTKTSNAGRGDGGKDWKGMLRLADRLFPDYRN